MKKVIYAVAILVAISLTNCKNNQKEKDTTPTMKEEVALTEASFGVRGNCGMCKKTIEKAATSVAGVSNADWDKDRKMIAVSFDASKTNAKEVHNSIAASGYDTDQLAANETAYENLHGCCKYDHEMEMSLSETSTSEVH